MNVLTRKFQGTKELIALVDVLQGASCLSEVLGHRQTVAGGLHRGVSNAMVPLIAHSAKPVEVSLACACGPRFSPCERGFLFLNIWLTDYARIFIQLLTNLLPICDYDMMASIWGTPRYLFLGATSPIPAYLGSHFNKRYQSAQQLLAIRSAL